jgi:hypothetical protein
MIVLIGLTVATLLIIGCFAGNLFVCVFLSLAPALGALIFFAQTPPQPGWGLVCIAVICVIWLPRYLRLRAHKRVYSLSPPPALAHRFYPDPTPTDHAADLIEIKRILSNG